MTATQPTMITKGRTGPPLAPATIVHHAILGRMRLMDVLEGDIVEVACTDDGVPYCSADGLEDWAGWVATDHDVGVFQYQFTPTACGEDWVEQHLTGVKEAPESHRHPGDWRESLYRAWRA